MSEVFRGRVVTADTTIDHAEFRIEDGIITEITPLADSPKNGSTFIPGFIDIHNHGGMGGAFPTGNAAECIAAAQFHRDHGTTTLLASLVSASEAEITKQLATLVPLVSQGHIFGIHLEGPFVNACRCGAQDPSRIVPGDPDMFSRLLACGGGAIKSMTFAPETPYAQELVSLCATNNVIVSLGHTDASYEETMQLIDCAVDAGATVTATHLFNAMPPIHHRKPGAAGAFIAAAGANKAFVELVADGVHLHDGTVDMIARNTNHAAVAVTDAMEAAGMPDGNYLLGSLKVEVKDKIARIENGAIAGGTSTLYDQFRRAASRLGMNEAVRLTSTNAARVLGIPAGDIAVGKLGHIVELDSHNQLVRTICPPSTN
ncbi:N-acetylglucosamine-6-phosphate deacetylase [Corynebacterium kutscheri]|uniref:N-acetylglucosamine-6-phosphate deacetylase n=1 Tax=Corynebacterium kutscheri TaxID=35755 RepID=A0A0F6R1N4_9CORY|nr:N-acetylglucosamine-6-phosphate deacetylase [Corynebacterium kutscheri]AKE41970.1 N-acetylglucosamine-6-phosphate deacetylase [Corynebacterium kutscheri]VEH06252.1 N-acetylglucosamine-6-phosphate deacetylase [Corynebacterium kutscheri]VEH10311.1 N-acetylglucosamine-6-phosphate deacetylase [Corynebacterium kutscheri]